MLLKVITVICHCWFFNYGFQFQDSICNCCYVVTIIRFYVVTIISNIAIITDKGLACCCNVHNITNSKTISLLENFVLEDYGYI